MPTTPLRESYIARFPPTPLAPVSLADDDPVIWCKLGYLNPSGSTKDRIARHMLEKAWRRGEIDRRLFRLIGRDELADDHESFSAWTRGALPRHSGCGSNRIENYRFETKREGSACFPAIIPDR
ncbi:MAG: hypothetical protein ABFS86_20225, partial [Planctomycetota bacterium]